MSSMPNDPKNFWWEIILQDRAEEPIYVTIVQAGRIAEAIKAGKSHVKVGEEIVAISSIKRVRQSDKIVTDEQERNLIESGILQRGKREPILNPETGDVMWRWAKTTVSKKKWDTYYSKSPGYYLIEPYYSSVVIGFRKPLETNQTLNSGTEWCNETEAAKLDQKLGLH